MNEASSNRSVQALAEDEALLFGVFFELAEPWEVIGKKGSPAKGTVEFVLGMKPSDKAECPRCGRPRPRRGGRRRRWRDMNFGSLKTRLEAEVPLVDCPEHGAVEAATPWADPGSRITKRLEKEVAGWLKNRVSRDAVAHLTGLSRIAVDGIAERAAKREGAGARTGRKPD